jgi:hypothetical protein
LIRGAKAGKTPGAGVSTRQNEEGMSHHVPHELHEEFPDHAARIDELIGSSARFARLAHDYREVNGEIQRIESGATPTADEVLEEFKKQRLHLLDAISDLLRH